MPCSPASRRHSREAVDVFRRGQRTLRFGPDEQFLAEVGHLPCALAFVECDQILERARRSRCASSREVRVEVRLELVEQDFDLARVEPGCRRDVCRIDDSRPLGFHVSDCRVDQGVGGRAVAEIPGARDADARALQRIRLQCGGVVLSCRLGRRQWPRPADRRRPLRSEVLRHLPPCAPSAPRCPASALSE